MSRCVSARVDHRPARYTAKIQCQVVRERDFRLIADRIVDLSPRGALVGPADPVLTGERVIISFAALGGCYVDAEAVVARVVHGRRRGEFTRYVGLSFETMDAWSRAALAVLLAWAVPVPPGARHERRALPRRQAA
ncbi:MAG: PilZ domain-containing protein [Myxococcota bacterium]